jgi:hypothetical protein
MTAVVAAVSHAGVAPTHARRMLSEFERLLAEPEARPLGGEQA